MGEILWVLNTGAMSETLLRKLAFAIPPETAHRLTIAALASGLGGSTPPADPRLRRRLAGLDFPNPLGLAAGFDKNGEVPDAILRLGFGFAEVGTVTPRRQAGNPRPRVFRLPRDEAVINRLGFNNEGFAAVARRLGLRPRRGIVGVNLGANRDSADRVGDYVAGVERFAGLADYLTINVSSPNTPGLRDLQEAEALAGLLSRVGEARARAGRSVPLFLKIAPDLDDDAVVAIVAAAIAAGIDGMVVSNTTVARAGLSDKAAQESGGLSGRPLFRRSTRLLARVRRLAGDRLVLIGVGGVDSAEAAWTKIAAGADLVQLYTGLIYKGPRLAARIVTGLGERLDREGMASIAEAVGSETDRWADSDPQA